MSKTSTVDKGPIDLRSSLDKQLKAYLKKKYPGGGWSEEIYQSLLRGALAGALVEHSAANAVEWPTEQVMSPALRETQMDKKGAREWAIDLGGWEAMAAKVLSDLKAQNLALSGDSALIVGTYQSIKRAGETNRWHDTPLNPGVSLRLARQGEEIGHPLGVEAGSETGELQGLFIRWLEQAPSLKGLTPVSSKGLTKPLAGLILEHTLAAGSDAASKDIYALLDAESAASIWKNPRFTESVFRSVVGHLVAEILSLGSGQLESSAWASAFLLEAARRGWKIQDLQVTSLGRLSRNCNARPEGASWGDLVSMFPDAVAEARIREDLLVNPGSVRLSRMIANTQGAAWAQVIKRSADLAEGTHRQWAAELERCLKRISGWNLEGVMVDDLLPLIASANDDLRKAGRSFSIVVEKIQERSEAQPAAVKRVL